MRPHSGRPATYGWTLLLLLLSGSLLGEGQTSPRLAAASLNPGGALAAQLALGLSSAPGPSSGMLWVYVGTYTQGKSQGINRFRMDRATGKLTPAGVVPVADNPSFLAIHPNHRFLYAVNEIGNFGGQKSGAVSAFAIDAQSGNLTLLNQQPSRGDGPCHLAVDKSGKSLLVANYGGGSVAALPIESDGRLGPATAFIQHQGSSANPQRQEGPHAHCVVFDRANRLAFAADLGLDKILVYRFDASKGTLVPHDPPAASVAPGSGPRHFVFHPNNRFAYVINEISSTVTAFHYDSRKGSLETMQTISTLPPGFTGNNSGAEIVVHPSGKFLYGSNRGHDSIVIYAVDSSTGRLTLIGHEPTQGKTPRNFAIDPTGTYLLAANQDSDSVVVFRIDATSGKLQPTGQTLEVPKPVCVVMMAGK
jgi:6-phosphogluconolactonase